MMNKTENQTKVKSAGRRRCLIALPAGIGAVVLCGVFGVLAIAADDDSAGPDIDGTRAKLEKYVQTRRVISQERQQWQLGKEMLQSRIDVVQREIDSLEEKIKEAEQNIEEAEGKRSELVDENEQLKETAAGLAEAVGGLEKRTRTLLDRLPDPILDRVGQLSQQLPDDPEKTKRSLGLRFQNVVGIINEVNKFNGEMIVTSEVRTLPGGSSAEVTALYVGIGQGYYVSAKGDVAANGTVSEEGWVWKPANDAAPRIADALAIMRNEQPASFVKLPVEVK